MPPVLACPIAAECSGIHGPVPRVSHPPNPPPALNTSTVPRPSMPLAPFKGRGPEWRP